MDVRDLLESDALRSFGVFAQHGNFTAAAAALGISQPALHVKVRKLAAGLGTELYERDGRSLVLTPAGERFLPGILAAGLQPRQRVHVHLSADPGTAATVGARRGQPVILRVDAAGMHAGGHEFFRAASGVWLTAAVPAAFISTHR